MTPPASILESDNESNAIAYANSIGYLTWKNTPEKNNGYPDRVFINRYGLHVYIEIKAPGKVPRKLQIYRINQLRERFCLAFWSDDIVKIRRILNAFVDTQRLPTWSYEDVGPSGIGGDTPRPGDG